MIVIYNWFYFRTNLDGTMPRPRKSKAEAVSDSSEGSEGEDETTGSESSDSSGSGSSSSEDGKDEAVVAKSDGHGPPSNQEQLARFYATSEWPDHREVTCVIHPETLKFYFKKM